MHVFVLDIEVHLPYTVAQSTNSKPPNPSIYLLLQASLCLPNSLDSLSHTNVIRLKFIQAHTNQQGSSIQAPPESLAKLGPSLLGNIINDNLLEAHVGVEEDGTADDGIHGGVDGTGGEGGDG